MVHKRKLTIGIVEEMAKLRGWSPTQRGRNELSSMAREQRILKLVKITGGYKLLQFENKKVVGSEVFDNKNLALIMLGESATFLD